MRLREARELVRTTQLGASVVMKGVVTEILNTVAFTFTAASGLI